jgi:hypothetical protein
MRKAARRRNLITIVLAVLVIAGVVWAVTNEKTADNKPSHTDVKIPPVSESEAGCDPIDKAEPQEAKHIAQGEEHPPYNTNPPTSGPHYAAPLAPIDPGFYQDPIEPEKVIHNLEHGMIVIWYSPDAPQETIDSIDKVTQQQPDATVAVPWDDMPSGKQLVLTAWAKLQPCVKVSQDVVDQFRTLYQGKGPENVGIPTFPPA